MAGRGALAAFGFAIALSGTVPAAIPLGGQWAFSPGDDPHGSDPELDDRLWPAVRVPGPWEAGGFEKYDGFAWLRVRFTRPGPGDLYLYLGRIADADETFVNGVAIGSRGKGPPFPVPLPFAERWYRIPAGVVTESNLVAVHVFNASGPGGILEGPSAARLGIRDRGPAVFTEDEVAKLLDAMPGFGSAPPGPESLARRAALVIPATAARRGSGREEVEGGIRLDEGQIGEAVSARGTQARYAEAEGMGEVACPPAVLFRSIRWRIRDAASGRPIRVAALDAVHFGFGARRTVASGAAGLRIAETIVVPASRPGVLFLLDIDVEPPRPLELVLECEPSLSILPGRPAERVDLRWDAERSALTASTAGGLGAVIDANLAWRPAAGGARFPGDPTVRLIAALDPEAVAKGRVAIAWVGADRGVGEALALAAYLLADPADVYHGALQVDESAAAMQLETGGAARDQAFAWAQRDVLSSFIQLPAVGGLHVPWKGPLAEAGRAELRLEDSLWIARAALRIGDASRVRATLAALIDGTDAPGIPARIMPGAGLAPAPDLRASSLLLIAVREYMGWTGDRSFPSAHWDRLFAIASWVDGTDPDGDGIPGPPGEAASIADASLRADALEAAAEMAEAMRRDAGRWVQTATAARSAIARSFWLGDRTRLGSERDSLSAGILADGTASERVGAEVAVALLSGGIDRGRADATITALSSGDLLSDWGVRSLSAADPAYDSARPGGGAIGAFQTGLVSMAAFRTERPWLGATLLDMLARWPRIFTPGSWPEWLDAERCRRTPASGDSVLGAAAYILAVVDGLFGIQPRAEAGEILVRPAGIRHASGISLSGVRARESNFSIGIRMLDESILVTVASPIPPPIDSGLRAVIAAPVPPYHSSGRVEIGRRREMGTLTRSGSASRLTYAAPIGRRIDIRFPLDPGVQILPVEPSFLPLDAPRATLVVRAIGRGRNELLLDVEGAAEDGVVRVYSPGRVIASSGIEVRWVGERTFQVRFAFPPGERTRLLRLTTP
ncbi:MAG: hypothetical protein JXP34_22285 [Planctomycetes bacterium]|nr:hypothetical protein [Planctomycetota bacterium]